MTMTLTIDRDNPTETKQAPSDAFRFDSGRVQFATRGEEQSQSKAVSLVARTSNPVEHWYWGKIVHDFAGMQSKSVVPLDWCHDPDEIVGKADSLDASSGELIAKGTIESVSVGDEADKIIKRSDRGIPYEASIYFDPNNLVLEWLPEDMTTEVNGRNVEGPLVIAREWTLRRIAICPSGADSGTEANFSSGAEGKTEFSLNWKGSNVTKSTETKPADQKPEPGATELKAGKPDEQKPAESTKTETGETGGKSKTEFELKFEKFTTRFGAEAGNEYLLSGISYEQALEKHLEKTETAKLSAEKSAKEAATKLKQVDLGEGTAVDTGAPPSGESAGKGDFSSNFRTARKKAAT